MSIEWQYTICGLIIGAALAWMLRSLIRIIRRKNATSGCHGCSLAETCNKKKP